MSERKRVLEEPRWVENRKAIHEKVRGTLLGRRPRQKLGIKRKVHLPWLDSMGKMQERPKEVKASLEWGKVKEGKSNQVFLFLVCSLPKVSPVSLTA